MAVRLGRPKSRTAFATRHLLLFLKRVHSIVPRYCLVSAYELPAGSVLENVPRHPVHKRQAAKDTGVDAVVHRVSLCLRSSNVGMPSRVRLIRTASTVRPVRRAISTSGRVPSKAMSSGVQRGPC